MFFPLPIDAILIKLSILYSKGSHVETSVIVMHIVVHIVILNIIYFLHFCEQMSNKTTVGNRFMK